MWVDRALENGTAVFEGSGIRLCQNTNFADLP